MLYNHCYYFQNKWILKSRNFLWTSMRSKNHCWNHTWGLENISTLDLFWDGDLTPCFNFGQHEKYTEQFDIINDSNISYHQNHYGNFLRSHQQCTRSNISTSSLAMDVGTILQFSHSNRRDMLCPVDYTYTTSQDEGCTASVLICYPQAFW